MGFVAHIPHYVAQFDYPQASAALLEGLEDVTGLQWDQTALKEAGESRQVEIATQIADSDDVRDVVIGLEQQYDAFHPGGQPAGRGRADAERRGDRRAVRAVPGPARRA